MKAQGKKADLDEIAQILKNAHAIVADFDGTLTKRDSAKSVALHGGARYLLKSDSIRELKERLGQLLRLRRELQQTVDAGMGGAAAYRLSKEMDQLGLPKEEARQILEKRRKKLIDQHAVKMLLHLADQGKKVIIVTFGPKDGIPKELIEHPNVHIVHNEEPPRDKAMYTISGKQKALSYKLRELGILPTRDEEIRIAYIGDRREFPEQLETNWGTVHIDLLESPYAEEQGFGKRIRSFKELAKRIKE